ncbi:MAG: TlpA family protein disulfide reductase [Chitinophagaceae bacterium]|nr:TlpA family protein disulfide reductase [Chitinophagaceae bacterium]
MKNLLLLLATSISLNCATAQNMQLTIESKSAHDSLFKLVLLYADGHYSIPALQIKTIKNRKTVTKLDIPFPVFALLKFDEAEKRILLIPGRNLSIHVGDSAEEHHLEFEGPAAKENQLIEETRLGKIPFYLKDEKTQNRFASMSQDSLENYLFDAVKTDVSHTSAQINAATVPDSIKLILSNDYRYVQQCYLYDLSSNYMRWAKNPAADSFAGLVMRWLPIPDSAMLRSGFFVNMMTSYQERYAVNLMAKDMRTDKKAATKKLETALGLPFDEIDRQVKLIGERYIIAWLYAKNNLPKSIQDKILFNKVLDAYSDGYINSARILFDSLQMQFPRSAYLSIARDQMAEMKRKFEVNSNNAAIKFYPDKKPATLAELIKPYKGKIVYLDVWGTWCGPCRMEMDYVGEMKKAMKGKDITFLYLDMDDDSKENAWHEYVKFYGIEGEHYRLTNKQIEGHWQEIKAAGGESASYPRYLIFDRQGKLVHVNAERPSSKEKLYKQLNEIL